MITPRPNPLDQIMARCVHFTGLGEEQCAAGVRYERFENAPGFPCLKKFDHGGHTCEQRRWTTQEEAEAILARHAVLEAKMAKATAVVNRCKEDFEQTQQTAFEEPCPACFDGRLRINIASSNGHAWVRCSTPDCVRWQE